MVLKKQGSQEFHTNNTAVDPVKRPTPNHLDRDISAEASNLKWVTDLTYLPTKWDWSYPALVLDLFRHKIVGWRSTNILRLA